MHFKCQYTSLRNYRIVYSADVYSQKLILKDAEAEVKQRLWRETTFKDKVVVEMYENQKQSHWEDHEHDMRDLRWDTERNHPECQKTELLIILVYANLQQVFFLSLWSFFAEKHTERMVILSNVNWNKRRKYKCTISNISYWITKCKEIWSLQLNKKTKKA